MIVFGDRRERARNLTRQVYDGEFIQAEVRRQTSGGVRDFLLRSVPVDEDTLYSHFLNLVQEGGMSKTRFIHPTTGSG